MSKEKAKRFLETFSKAGDLIEFSVPRVMVELSAKVTPRIAYTDVCKDVFKL